MFKIFALVIFFILAGCCHCHKSPEVLSANTPAQRLGAQIIFKSGSSPVGQYISSTRGFDTNSYWIEGPDGLIFIDTQFLLSAGEEAIDLAEKTTGKKVKLAIVLHPNPDKFNGTATFKNRGIQVVTSEQVRQLIPAVHALRKSWFYERFKPDYPAEFTLPDSFGSHDVELKAAGLTVKAHVLRAGCSGAHVVIEYEKHLFTGDLVHNGYHAWLELGKIHDWIDRLHELKNYGAEYVHPGRGMSGDGDLIENQEKYLNAVVAIIKKQNRKVPLTDEKIDEITDQVEDLYPTFQFPLFISKGIPALWKAKI